MASAIIEALLSKAVYHPQDMSIFDISPEHMAPFVEKGIAACENAIQLVRDSEMILLAVKPNQMGSLLNEIGCFCAGKCLVSIAAGISSGFIRERICADAHVVRVMPNSTILLGCGATAIAKAPGVPQIFFENACNIFASAGIVEVIDEAFMNAIVGVNGSSPAYFYRMIASMADCAVRQGLDRTTALRLAAKTMEGAALMLLDGKSDPAALVRQVATPGGTTEAALRAMDRLHFNEAICGAMLDCTNRTRELSEDIKA